PGRRSELCSPERRISCGRLRQRCGVKLAAKRERNRGEGRLSKTGVSQNWKIGVRVDFLKTGVRVDFLTRLGENSALTLVRCSHCSTSPFPGGSKALPLPSSGTWNSYGP